MILALATIYDWDDVNRGSGTYYFFAQSLKRLGHGVQKLGPAQLRPPLLSRVLRLLHRLRNQQFPVFLDPLVGRRTARQIDGQLLSSGLQPEVLVTNDMCIAAFVKTARHIVIYTDMMLTYDYQERRIPSSKLANISALGLHAVQAMFRRAMQRADLCVFPAEWSAGEAVRYGTPPAKVAVVPFGANIDDPGPGAAARRLERVPTKDRVDVLFIGRDWGHKGGDVALECVELLRAQGINATLHVAGECPSRLHGLAQVKAYGYLDKRQASGRRLMDRLYRDCDVLLLPSRREGFGIVTVEAAAYGVPTIAYGVSGLQTAVAHGQTGLLLPEGATARSFANPISAWVNGVSGYCDFAVGARRHFELSGSWDVACSKLVELIRRRSLN